MFPAVLSHSPFPFNDAAVVGGVREDAAAAAAADGAGPSAGPSEGPLIAGPAPINAATGLTDWGAVAAFLKINWALPEVTWAQPGERAAEAALAAFLESARRVDKYDTEADDPNKPEVRSMLSAHIRYGHLSAQRCCLELVRVAGGAIKDVFVSRAANGMQAWAEEILVRRELSDNFCFFEERVSSPRVAAAVLWAGARRHPGPAARVIGACTAARRARALGWPRARGAVRRISASRTSARAPLRRRWSAPAQRFPPARCLCSARPRPRHPL